MARSDGVNSVKMIGAIEYGKEINATYESKYMGYTFSGVAGAKIRLTLLGDVAQRTDTLLFLYGPGSANAWGGVPIEVDDDGAGDLFSKIEFELPSDGEFLVVASLFNSRFEGKTFSLQLDCLSDSCVGTKPAEDKGFIGIEVDHFQYGQKLLPETKDLIVTYFASIGYTVDMQDDEELESVDLLEGGMNKPQLKDLHLNHFGHRGQKGWHYLILVDRLVGGRGWGMMNGDLFVISNDMTKESGAQGQAHIIMHELGHNLGLEHEGFEPEISAGTHSPETCASSGFPAHPPVLMYSPACIAHINLDSKPYVK